ncbi:MFS transporter [Methanomassiliicoccus luminyensis]|uniref:MFS transporter n=1 Tax=Methanomassiliicoccus luminyensis TaxID=1080712 RepID=UPI000474A629|nr:MFS transporter [Methanomassiliicoccus luminyensis]
MVNKLKGMGYGGVVLSVTTIGVLISSIQGSALLIILPEMMQALNMDLLTIMWVLMVYLLILTAMVPVFGRLADMFGRKRLYVLGFAVFTIGSLLCGLSQPQFRGVDLIIYRIVQAMGGALLTANGPAMIADAFDARHLGFGLGVNMVAGGAGLVLGPLVGGALAPFGWEWIFLINVPIGIVGTLWALHRLREPVLLPKGQSFDWLGSGVFLAGLVAILLGLSFVAFPAVDQAMIIALFVFGALGMVAFIAVERKAKYPMMDLNLFKNREFAMGNATMFLNSLARGAVLFLLIFFLQGPYEQDPLTAGISLIPFGITFVVMGPISGRLSDRYGPRPFIIAGLALSALALLGFATIDHNTPFWLLATYMAMMGIGGGLFASPNSSSVMNTVRPEKRGIAAGTRSMLMNIGSMFSLALAFPLVMTDLPMDDLMNLFLYGGGISPGALAIFESGLHMAFLLFMATSVLAVAMALVKAKPRQMKFRENGGEPSVE